jgi:glycosyltransferase involved in cell wall biosynthesis
MWSDSLSKESVTLKIAVNLRRLPPGKISKIEWYARNLLKYLLDADKRLELILFVSDDNDSSFDFDPKRVEIFKLSQAGYCREISAALREKGINVYFCPLQSIEPITLTIPSVVTIPDMHHEFYPELYSSDTLDWRRLHYKASASVADAVLTFSDFSARAITERLGVSDARVFPVYLAADAGFTDGFDPEDLHAPAETIKTVQTDKEPGRDLIKKGQVRAGKFSWRDTAKQTLKVFHKVAKPAPLRLRSAPLVSVITPSYNQGEFIEDTILSVLRQNYGNFEYIIMDGGSTDATREILEKYGKQLTWVSEKDNGQADAVNKGFRKAKGKILGWLNSDDTYLPGAIGKAVDYLTANPHMVMVYGNAFHTGKTGCVSDFYPTEAFNLKRLAESCFICQPTVFIRAAALKEIGELNVDLQTCMDFDLWIRLGKKFKGRIGYLPDFLATSRWYPENKSLSLRTKVYEEIFATVRKHFGYVSLSWKILSNRDKHIAGLEKQISQLFPEISALRNASAENGSQIIALNQAVAERDAKISALTQTLAERDAKISALTQTLAERDEQISALSRALAERDNEIISLRQQLDTTSDQLNRILRSKSWRFTKPFRFLERFFPF